MPLQFVTNVNSMKKSTPKTDPDLAPEYDFSNGVRGSHTRRYAEGSNVVVLDPDVAKTFPNAEEVNRALCAQKGKA